MKEMKKVGVSFMMVFLNVLCLAGQNLVPNSSFEIINSPLNNFSESYQVFDNSISGWTSCSHSTPDLICEENYMEITSETKINSPVFGQNSVGLTIIKGRMRIVFESLVVDSIWSEAIQIKLLEKIEKDSVYLFSCWLSSNAPYKPHPGFGFVLQDSLAFENHQTHVRKNDYYPIINVPGSGTWKKYNLLFKSKINSGYLSVGFLDPSSFPEKCDYYITIDNIKLEKITSPTFNLSLEEVVETNLIVGNALPNFSVFFNNNDFIVSPKYYSLLDALADFIKITSDIKLEIRGLTNSIGNEFNNNVLSVRRARSVYNYLLEKGVDSLQIKYIGLGEVIPNNDHKDNIRSSRRVDFYLVEVSDVKELYLKSCDFSERGNMDSTFYFLKKVFAKGFFEDEILIDPALKPFFKTKSGKAIKNTFREFFKKNNPLISNPTLAFALYLLLQEDQLYLSAKDDFFKLRSLTADEVKSLRENFQKTNETHLKFLSKTTLNHTYLPPRHEIGYVGMDAIFAIVQHSNDEKLLAQYCQLFDESKKEDPYLNRYLPFMIDRLSVMKKEPQIYGTQYYGKNGNLYPIEKPEEVNERRKGMGLPPLEEEQLEKQ